MKKSILFVAIAAIAVIATSCKPKVDAPKAAFGYQFEELTVTFENLSKNATSYEWNFGDGSEISTEANPVHVYAEGGSYTVSLTAINEGGKNTFTDEVSLVAAPVKIDGEFADWDKLTDVPTAKFGPENAGIIEDKLTCMKFYVDEANVYFYLECATTDETLLGAIDMYIDADLAIDPDLGEGTGETTHLFSSNNGAEYLVEFGYGDLHAPDESKIDWNDWSHCGLYVDDPETVDWSWKTDVALDVCEVSDKVKANGVTKFEGKFAIARLTIPGNEFGVAVALNDVNWGGESGILPAGVYDMEEATTVASEYLKIKL